jgi:hypothetical protein
MPRNRTLPGRLTQFERPNWDPLIDLVGLELVRSFMWMNELELEDGTVVHAYKHIWTRQYVHLGVDGRVFEYRRPGRYREVDSTQALELAFFTWSPDEEDAREALEELMKWSAT